MQSALGIFGTNLRKALAQIRHMPDTLSLVWDATRRWTLVWVVLLLVQGVLPAATVYLARSLINGLQEVALAGGDWKRMRPVLVLAALVAALVLAHELLRVAAGLVRTVQSELLRDHISGLIHEQSVAADLAFYESPEFFDHLHRARDQAGYRSVALLENTGSLLQNGVTLLAMAAVLVPYGWWLPVALLTAAMPAFYVMLAFALREHQWRLRNTENERRTWYYDWVLTSKENAAELRLFALGDHFRALHRVLRQRLRDERVVLSRRQALSEAGAAALGLLVTGAALLWMVWRVLHGRGTLGDLALFYAVFSRGQAAMRSFTEHIGQIYYNCLFLGNLFEFLDLAPRVVSPAAPRPVPAELRDGIRFRGVSFRYPGSGNAALSDFDVHLPAGRIVAIVGPNGAGKSTLIKLLCRLYDPDRGRIEIDGVDLRDLPVAQYRRLVTVLFQQPVQYSVTAADNIALGDLPAAPGASEIEAAAGAAGADEPISRLPRGYDTLLGKWFAGGAELSVGEWQRVALARAFLRRAPIILLDEPTSAMDSWAEGDWLQRFRTLAEGRTAVLITHRFTTAMHADVIHVMQEGRIVESGSHAELVERAGPYAQSWHAQMERGQLVVQGEHP